LWVLYGIR